MTLRSLRRNAEVRVIDAARYYRHGASSEAYRALVLAVDELDQINLNAPTKARAVRKAPETSHEAAAYWDGRAGKPAYRILMSLRAAHLRGMVGLTCDQLEQDLHLPHTTCSARVNQLRDEGWIVDSGERRPTRSNQPAIVWKATMSGLYELVEPW